MRKRFGLVTHFLIRMTTSDIVGVCGGANCGMVASGGGCGSGGVLVVLGL